MAEKDVGVPIHLKVPEMKILELTNSVDPYTVAHTKHLIWIYTNCPLIFEFSIVYSMNKTLFWNVADLSAF